MIKTTLFTVFTEGRIITKDTAEDYRYAWGIWDVDSKIMYDYGFAQTQKALSQQARLAMKRRRQERDLELNRQYDALLTDEEAYGNIKMMGARVLSENAFISAMQNMTMTVLANELAVPDLWVKKVRKYTYFRDSGIKYDITTESKSHAFAIFSEGKGCPVEWGLFDDMPSAVDAARTALTHWQSMSTALMKEKISSRDLSPDPYGVFRIEIADVVDEAAFKSLALERTREQVQTLLGIGESVWNKEEKSPSQSEVDG